MAVADHALIMRSIGKTPFEPRILTSVQNSAFPSNVGGMYLDVVSSQTLLRSGSESRELAKARCHAPGADSTSSTGRRGGCCAFAHALDRQSWIRHWVWVGVKYYMYVQSHFMYFTSELSGMDMRIAGRCSLKAWEYMQATTCTYVHQRTSYMNQCLSLLDTDCTKGQVSRASSQDDLGGNRFTTG